MKLSFFVLIQCIFHRPSFSIVKHGWSGRVRRQPPPRQSSCRKKKVPRRLLAAGCQRTTALRPPPAGGWWLSRRREGDVSPCTGSPCSSPWWPWARTTLISQLSTGDFLKSFLIFFFHKVHLGIVNE
jgi:hypothetical protein